MIKEYFANYFLHMSDVTFDMKHNTIHVHQCKAEPWRVTLINTGDLTMTGGRLAYLRPYLKDEDAFCMTYGDGVSDVNIEALINFHRNHGGDATVTAVQPSGRYGALLVADNDQVKGFIEKPRGDGGWINGGFFVLSPKCLDLIHDDQTPWEQEPLETLAASGRLHAFRHTGFWQPMDTLRDKAHLEQLWNSNKAPWKIW